MNMKVMRAEELEDSIREAYFQWRENMEPYGFNGIDAFTAGVAWALSQQDGNEVASELATIEEQAAWIDANVNGSPDLIRAMKLRAGCGEKQ